MFKKKGLPRLEEELIAINDEKPIESWRIFKIIAEFVNGFELLQHYELAATFFGTARCTPDMKIYEDATLLSRRLSKGGFTIITGGGPGVMEAANKGAVEAEGESVGINIELPEGQRKNKYVKTSESFHYFFVRKVMLAFSSDLYIFFPGGFGTMDEFFELTTLIQTEKIKKVPIILVGKEYWEPLTKGWIEKVIYEKYTAINKEDMNIYTVVDSVDEACEAIARLFKKHYKCSL